MEVLILPGVILSQTQVGSILSRNYSIEHIFELAYYAEQLGIWLLNNSPC